MPRPAGTCRRRLRGVRLPLRRSRRHRRAPRVPAPCLGRRPPSTVPERAHRPGPVRSGDAHAPGNAAGRPARGGAVPRAHPLSGSTSLRTPSRGAPSRPGRAPRPRQRPRRAPAARGRRTPHGRPAVDAAGGADGGGDVARPAADRGRHLAAVRARADPAVVAGRAGPRAGGRRPRTAPRARRGRGARGNGAVPGPDGPVRGAAARRAPRPPRGSGPHDRLTGALLLDVRRGEDPWHPRPVPASRVPAALRLGPAAAPVLVPGSPSGGRPVLTPRPRPVETAP